MQNHNIIPATEILSQYASKLRYEDLPETVVERVKQLFLEYLRVGILGSRREWGKRLWQLIESFKGSGRSRILIYGTMIDSPRASLINGTFAGGLDWDDTHVGSMLHPGVVIFPAAIAVAEQLNSNGKQFIPAIAAAYDAMIRIGLSVQPTHFKRGFQSTPTCGVFGAAIAAAKLFNMDSRKIISSLGIAGSYASGLTQFYEYGSEVKRIHAGKGSEGGVMAALIAKSGIDGPPYILEGDYGFCRAYSDSYDLKTIIENLGTDFKIMEVTIRPSACSARIQASIEASFNVIKNHQLSLSDIKQIKIGIPLVVAGRLTHKEPPDLQAAQLSIPFSVALTFYLGRKGIKNNYLSIWDYEENIQNSEVRNLASRIVCEVDEDIDKKTTTVYVPSRLKIKLNSGEEIIQEVAVPKGSPQNPLTMDEIKERFINQVESIVNKETCYQIIEKINNLQELPTVSLITELVKGIKE